MTELALVLSWFYGSTSSEPFVRDLKRSKLYKRHTEADLSQQHHHISRSKKHTKDHDGLDHLRSTHDRRRL